MKCQVLTLSEACRIVCQPSAKQSRRKEGNVYFNDPFNTFYLRLYGFGHMVKDYSDSEKRNLLLPHGLSFQFAARILLYAPPHRQESTYNNLCYTSLERKVAQWVHHEGSIRWPIAPWANAHTTLTRTVTTKTVTK